MPPEQGQGLNSEQASMTREGYVQRRRPPVACQMVARSGKGVPVIEMPEFESET